MIEANEIDEQNDKKIDFKPSAYVNLSNTSKIELTNSSNMSLTSSTTATILQAYAARLNSDSDYARYVIWCLDFIIYLVETTRRFIICTIS